MEKANQFADKYNIPKRYSSYEDLVKDPEIDVIYVSTPHNYHYANVKLCLEHGKNVLCEKPITINAKQARELFDLAKRKQLFIMEGMWTRCMPFSHKVCELIKEGRIGKVKLVNCDIGFNPFESEDLASRLLTKEEAGGALLDIGVYGVSFASMIYGKQKPSKISALSQLSDTGVDELSVASLLFGHNELSVTTATLGINPPGDAWIIGDNGKIRVHGPHFNCAHEISVYDKDSQLEERILFPIGSEEGYNYPGGPLFVHEAIEVMQCLHHKTGESNLMPHFETIQVLETLDECRRQIGVVYEQEPYEVSTARRVLQKATDAVENVFDKLHLSEHSETKDKTHLTGVNASKQ